MFKCIITQKGENMLKHYLVLSFGIPVVFFTLLISNGCGPRTEVLIDKAKKAIDAQLGTIDVQIKELDGQVASLKNTSKEIEKSIIRSKIEIDKINEDLKPTENRKIEIEKALSSLRESLKDSKNNNKPILVGKKEVKPEDFNSMVDKLIEARKPLLEILDSQNQSKKKLEEVLASLNEKDSKIKTALSKFENQKSALLVQKDAAVSVQKSSSSNAAINIDDQIKAVENKIKDIQTDVKLALAESNFPSAQNKEINEIDSIIKKTKSSEDVLNQLDKILGPTENK